VASLVEPDGREVWRAAPTGWVVPTNDAFSRHEASIAAAENIADALFDGWKAE
jgi:hypothetical protein